MLREFFYLAKGDRRVLSFLLSLAVLLGAVLYLGHRKQATANHSATDTTLLRKTPIPSRHQPFQAAQARRVERFAFDPNTADSTALLRLGLSPWQVRNIYKYRAKGGIYRRKEDFARLYGLTLGQYRSLAPYIRIAPTYQPAARFVATAPAKPDHTPPNIASTPAPPRYPEKLRAGETVPLNTADTTLLRRVPGIGSYYARQVVQYRQRLGGFADVAQLRDIEGFPEQALAYMEVDATQVRRINLNRLTLDQLRRHPYVNFHQARAIADYRRLKGPLQSLDQLRLLKEFTPADLQRLAPYVEF